MAKVLFINPPLTDQELYRRGSIATASIIPPLGLAYLAAVLERAGHEVRIIDGIASDISFDETVAAAAQADIVGITVLSAFFLRAAELIRAIKLAARAPLVVGGAHATAMPLSLLEAGADVAVIGEGEATILELVDALVRRTPALDDVRGIAFLKDGRLVQTPRRPLILDLDTLPMPARHLLPMDRYKTSEARTSRHPSHSLIVSRGCQGNCTFCFKGAFGTGFRCHSPARIVEEMFVLREQYHAREVAFWDDNFTTNKEVVLEVCRLLEEKNFGLPWSCEARIDAVDEQMLRAMKRAGCVFVAYGIESGSDRVLRSINKRIDTAAMLRVVRMTRRVGIPVRGYFMLGLVGETEAEMRQTIDFALRLDPDIATFTFLVPLPGCADYVRAQRDGGSFDPDFFRKRLLPEFNFLDAVVYCPAGMTPERMIALHQEAYRRFYYRPAFLLKELSRVRGVADIKRLWHGARTLFGS